MKIADATKLLAAVSDVELHQGDYATYFYTSFVDQIKALANEHGKPWSSEIENALVSWQAHRMFGEEMFDPQANAIVEASHLFSLKPRNGISSESVPMSRQQIAGFIRESMLRSDEFISCDPPHAKKEVGLWWAFSKNKELFLFFDLPIRGTPVAYPSLVFLDPLRQIDLGLMLPDLIVDARSTIGNSENAVDVLCEFCQLFAEPAKQQ